MQENGRRPAEFVTNLSVVRHQIQPNIGAVIIKGQLQAEDGHMNGSAVSTTSYRASNMLKEIIM